GDVGPPRAAEYGDGAGGGLVESLADLDRRGLTGTIGTEQAEAFTGPDLEVELVNGASLPVKLPEPVDGNGWLSGHSVARFESGDQGAGQIPEAHQLASTFEDPDLW